MSAVLILGVALLLASVLTTIKLTIASFVALVGPQTVESALRGALVHRLSSFPARVVESFKPVALLVTRHLYLLAATVAAGHDGNLTATAKPWMALL